MEKVVRIKFKASLLRSRCLGSSRNALSPPPTAASTRTTFLGKNCLCTCNNQRLGSVFHNLDPRLSLLCRVGDDVIRPLKICGGCQIRFPRSIIHCNQLCLMQCRLQSVLGVLSFYVECNYIAVL